MEEDRYQKEFFEFEKPKRQFKVLGNIFYKAAGLETRYAVMLTLDKIIFILIGVLMAMVILYALGVERGKTLKITAAYGVNIGPRAVLKERAEQSVAYEKTIVTRQGIQGRETEPVGSHRPLVVNRAAAVPTIKTAASTYSSAPYTIVAATFSKKETAQNDAERLKKEGFDAFVIYSEPYFQVCTGAYPDKEGAQIKRDLKAVRRIYRDAYPRLR